MDNQTITALNVVLGGEYLHIVAQNKRLKAQNDRLLVLLEESNRNESKYYEKIQKMQRWFSTFASEQLNQ